MSVNRIFGANSVDKSDAGALNDISRLALTGGDIAVVRDGNDTTQLDSIHFYRYDSVSTEPVDVYPTIIRPSDVVGAGVWYMISPQYFMENLIVEAGNKVIVNEIVGNDSGLSLGFQDGTIDIVIGATEITITKDITTDSQIISTIVTGTAPFVVASTTQVDNLNVEFVAGEPRSNISLLDGTGDAFSAIPQVTNELTVVPSDPKDFTTVQYIDDLLASSGEISHGDLADLLVDDHTQYSLVDGTRAYTAIPGVTNAVTVFPSADAHLTTKKYVDDEITSLGLGAGGDYIRRDGTVTASAVLSYDVGVTPAGANDLTDVEYVDGVLTAHTSGADPHTEYLLADATRVTLARLHTDVGDGLAINSQTDYTYIVRSDIDFWLTEAILTSGLSNSDFYQTSDGEIYLSNIVHRDYPKTVADYSSSNVSSNVHNLVTYGFLYEQLGELVGATEVIGSVVDVTVTATGTGGFTVGTNNIYTTTPITGAGVGLTVRAFINFAGNVETITVESDGSGYVAGNTVNIDGGNNDTVVEVDKVFVDGAQHGNLGELLDDQHTQYSLVDGSRGFTSPVAGISSTSSGGDEDGELATRLWVVATVGGGPGSLDHDADILNVATSTAHDNYMYVDPIGLRGFTGVPFLDTIAFPDPAGAIVTANQLATKAYIDTTVGNDFVKTDGSNVLFNNQIYNPQVPHDFFLDKGDANNLINKDYVDEYLGRSLVSDDDEYMGYFYESFVSNNPLGGVVINDGALTAVELNIASALKGGTSRASINNGDGSTTKFFVYDGGNVLYPQTFPVWLDGSLSSTNLTEKYIFPISNETNSGTGAGLVISVVTPGVLVGDESSGDTTIINAGYAFTANDDIALEYQDGGTGSGAILHVNTVDSRGAILTYNFSGGSGSGGSGYSVSDEIFCPNTNAPIKVVRGDIVGFGIIAESGTVTDGTHPFEVSGDGANSFWDMVVSGGSITQFNQTGFASPPYTNTGTTLSMTEIYFPTVSAGTFEIRPYVFGEVVDIDVVEDGHGYTSATYNYTNGAGGFIVGGYDSGGATTLDIDYINPLDEKVEVMHYEKGTLATAINPKLLNYVVTPGNIISGLLFDDWGHIQDVTESGSPAGTWLETSSTLVAMDGSTNYMADCSANVMEMRLPAAPVLGTSVIIDDYTGNSSSFNITVKDDAGGTPLIETVSSDLIIDVDGSRVYMTYVDGTFGWRYKVI